MKHFTKFLLILLLLLQIPTFAQVSGDFRSKSSGDWGNFAIWQVYNGTTWVNATSGQIPGGTNESNANSVYIEATHTVTLSSDQSCKDLNLNTSADVVRINTQQNTLSVWGKMRYYQGTAPGTNSTNSGVLGWISTGTNGYIRFRGTADRVVMVQSQVNANNTNSGWNLDFAFDPGFTGQINDRMRAGNITVSSGTLFVNNPTGELRVGTNNGANDLTPNGQFLIKSGATVKGGSGIFKKSNVAAESITVESGGNLIIDRPFYVLAATSLNLNGTVTLQNSIRFPTSAGRASAATVNTFNNLILAGPGSDTLQTNITVNGRLTLKGTASLNLSSYSLSYGSAGELEYNGSVAQSTTNAEFPASSGPASLIINNSNGVTLHASRTISNQLTLSSGLLFIGDNNLTLGANSPSIAGTFSETAMIVTNGSGKVNKIYGAAGSYLYPVGDNNSTAEYSPAQINVTTADLFNGTTQFGIRVINNVHPSSVGNSDNLSRYWEVSTNMTGYKYDGTFQYLTSDVTGTESNLNSFLFADETASSTRIAINAVNSASHQIQIANQNKVGFIGGSNFGCSISNNTITTTSSSYCPGQNLIIDAATATVSSGVPLYQWQINKNGGSWMNVGTNEDYLLPDTTTPGQFNIRRIVTDPINCISGNTSNAIVITINTPASITANPSNVTTCAGSTISFSGSGAGTGLSYRWQVSINGGNLWQSLANNNLYSNSTTPSLTITNVPSAYNNYLYRLMITGACGTVYTNSAALSISSPLVSKQPSNTTVCSGSNASFSVTATGNGLTYQWQESTDGGTIYTSLAESGIYSNTNTATLTITGVSLGMNNYKYRCIVSGSCGGGTTSNAGLLIINSPTITSNPSNVATCANTIATFSGGGSGSGLTYRWQVSYNGGTNWYAIADNNIYSGTVTSNLTITNVPSSYNNYNYRLSITGSCGTSYTNSATLTITSPLISGSPANTVRCAGTNASFSVSATGNGLTYQWQESTDGGTIYNSLAESGIYSNTNTASLTITGVSIGMNSNKYRCVVSGSCGGSVTSNPGILTVNSSDITSNPSNVIACATTTASFSGGGSGGGLTYRWQVSYNGGNTWLALANNGIYSGTVTPILTITNVPTAYNNYKYRLMITSTCGTAYTQAALLTVNSGCSSKLSSNDQVELEPQITAYPNPFSDIINIYLTGFEGNVNVNVKDLNGKVVYSKENTPSNEPLTFGSELSSGLYILEIINDRNQKSIKILKSN